MKISKLIKIYILEILKEDFDYRVQHTAPDHHYGCPLYDLTLNGIYPKDVYDNLSHYSDGVSRYDVDSLPKVKLHRNKPDSLVTVYRAIPKDLSKEESKINIGDWVTTSLNYAKDHASDLEGPGKHGKIVSKKVPAKNLWTDGNSLSEWGYEGS